MWTAAYVQSNSFVNFLQTAPDSKWLPSWLKVDLWSSLAPSQPMSRCHLSSVKTTEENMKASQTPKHRTSVYHTYRHAVKLWKMITENNCFISCCLFMLKVICQEFMGFYDIVYPCGKIWNREKRGFSVGVLYVGTAAVPASVPGSDVSTDRFIAHFLPLLSYAVVSV